jgi:hypothetical protein
MSKKKHFLAERAPFADTKIPYSTTKGEIDEMLKEAGAIALRWRYRYAILDNDNLLYYEVGS